MTSFDTAVQPGARPHAGRARRRRTAATAALLVALASVGIGRAAPAVADTRPAPGVPATVSADVLPTVQINGIVRGQVVVGNTVYATGDFSAARPAGSPLGVDEVPRGNLLAYDITTGALSTTFVHTLSGGGGSAVAASPDGTRLYVGGSFSQVDGVDRLRIAAFDLTQPGAPLVPTFTNGVDRPVADIVATNDTVFAGGSFTGRLRSWDRSGAVRQGWSATADGNVFALVLTPDGSKLVVGGGFTTLNGRPAASVGAVSVSTGATITPWASASSDLSVWPIRNVAPDGAVTSLSTDGTNLYISGYNFGDRSQPRLEGTAALSPTDGTIRWIGDCHGDTYDAFPMNGVLYSVSHAHDCANIGGFPESPSRRALAQTTTVGGVNTHSDVGGYYDFAGWPRPNLLHWYPTLNVGTASGVGQAAWSVTGNSDYIVLGGEFTIVDGVAQQGLVRYAIASVAPDLAGPTLANWQFPGTATVADATGRSAVSFAGTWDPDNTALTYSVFRGTGSTTPVWTYGPVKSNFWTVPTLSFVDRNLIPGAVHRYRIVATDPFGNSVTAYTGIDQDTTAATYLGSWNTISRGIGDIYDDVRYTTTVGDSAVFKVTGTNVSVIGNKAPDQGLVSISVDGGAPVTVNTAVPAGVQVRATLWATTGLSNTLHTVRVTNLQPRSMVIDGVYVFNRSMDVTVDGQPRVAGSALPINDTSPAITWSGQWFVDTTRAPAELTIGRDIHYTPVDGATATFSFVGSGVDVLGLSGVGLGTAEVIVDGVSRGVFSQSGSGANIASTLVSLRDLTMGAHTVVVKKLSGNYLVIDGFAAFAGAA
ncbi:WD40 repeat domain-containing protein [Nakamurella deserti]|uniref:WD40 repeat domain-containing protein n=1 Tax=Nakamurella deserti TaxID=2164074 RepID=UPI00130039E9|nr:WD40 repeat domain-containing protein [Nakamurella deserti]